MLNLLSLGNESFSVMAYTWRKISDDLLKRSLALRQFRCIKSALVAVLLYQLHIALVIEWSGSSFDCQEWNCSKRT